MATQRPPAGGPMRRASTTGKKIIPYSIPGMKFASLSTPEPHNNALAGPSTLSSPSSSQPQLLSKSCLECSRLKIRCSRTVPCTSCVRRGVEQICPAGKMESGKGRRLILADSKDLHERIGLLERALARSHEEKLRAERELDRGKGASADGTSGAGKASGAASGSGKARTSKRARPIDLDLESTRPTAPTSENEDHAPQLIDGPDLVPEADGEDGYQDLLLHSDQHPALRDAYLYSPKDPPRGTPYSPMIGGSGSGGAGRLRDDTPIRDVRDGDMSEDGVEDADEGDRMGSDEGPAGEEGGSGAETAGGSSRTTSRRGTTRGVAGKRVKLEPGSTASTKPYGRPPNSKPDRPEPSQDPPPNRGPGTSSRRGKGATGKNAKEEGQDQAEQAEISLGTLTIGAQGEAVYIGAAGGSSFLHESGPSPPLSSPQTYEFRVPRRSLSARHRPNVSLPSASGSVNYGLAAEDPHTALVGDFPLAGSSSLSLHDLWAMIPAWEDDPGEDHVMEKGNLMVQAYWENCDWMYNTLPRPIFDADYLPAVYESQTAPSPHKLACVYMVMALGVMFDLERREPFDPQGGELFRLGVACLTINGALSRPTVATVQALNLMGNFMLNDRSPYGAQSFWPFLGVAANCVTALGLHRDGSNFGGLSPYEIEERRKVFWEMTTLDRLQAMCFARPCALSNRSIDSKFPGEDVEDESLRLPDPDGYFRAKYELVKLMDHIIDEQTRTTKGTYQGVLTIDKKIVDFRETLPDMMLPEKKASALDLNEGLHPHVMMHRFSIRLLVCETRIYLHRLYFVKALAENPSDPSMPGSAFSKSFVAVFESAAELISVVRQCVLYHPTLTSRWWFFWFHAFSAAVCLAAVCIRAPASAFAGPAYMSLVISCDIASAAAEGTKAKGGLPVLLRLRQRASDAMLSMGTGRSLHPGEPSAFASGSSPGQGSSYGTAGDAHAAVSTTTPEPIKRLSDDDLSHLSNRPQLRRVHPDLTSPVGSTPALMTDDGPGSSTGNTRSAGSAGNTGGSFAGHSTSGSSSSATSGGHRFSVARNLPMPAAVASMDQPPPIIRGAQAEGFVSPYGLSLGERTVPSNVMLSQGSSEEQDDLELRQARSFAQGPPAEFGLSYNAAEDAEALGETMNTSWHLPTVRYDAELDRSIIQPELSLSDIDAYGMFLTSENAFGAAQQMGSMDWGGTVLGETAAGGGSSRPHGAVLSDGLHHAGGSSTYGAVEPPSEGYAYNFVPQFGPGLGWGGSALAGTRAAQSGNPPPSHEELPWRDPTLGFADGDQRHGHGHQAAHDIGRSEFHSQQAWPSQSVLPMMSSAGTQEDLDRFLTQMMEDRT